MCQEEPVYIYIYTYETVMYDGDGGNGKEKTHRKSFIKDMLNSHNNKFYAVIHLLRVCLGKRNIKK